MVSCTVYVYYYSRLPIVTIIIIIINYYNSYKQTNKNLRVLIAESQFSIQCFYSYYITVIIHITIIITIYYYYYCYYQVITMVIY